jgi:hypothetical protein
LQRWIHGNFNLDRSRVTLGSFEKNAPVCRILFPDLVGRATDEIRAPRFGAHLFA